MTPVTAALVSTLMAALVGLGLGVCIYALFWEEYDHGR